MSGRPAAMTNGTSKMLVYLAARLETDQPTG
jgi:hypothetical protein